MKFYASDFCRVKVLREATREQIENFVVHLADWAEKDRKCQQKGVRHEALFREPSSCGSVGR